MRSFQSKSRLGANTAGHSRRATEAAGISAVSALRVTGLFSDALRRTKRAKRANKIQRGSF